MERYIQIPGDITLKNPDGSDTGVTMKFVGWARDVILVDNKVGVSAATLFLANDLRQKFADKQEGDVVELTEKEWELMKGIVEEPTGGYAPGGAMQIIVYLRAVLDAPTKRPELKQLAS
jgi:hypothetical protein